MFIGHVETYRVISKRANGEFYTNKYQVKRIRFHPEWQREQQRSLQPTPYLLDLAQKV